MNPEMDVSKTGGNLSTRGIPHLLHRHARSLRRFMRRHWEAYLFLVPSVLLVIAVLLYPLAYGVGISFTDKELMSRSVSYVGLQNYVKLFADEVFRIAIGNTVVWTVYVVAGRLGLGFLLALLLHHIPRGRQIFRILFLIPWAVPSIVVGIMFKWLYDPLFGYVNQYLKMLNLVSEPILFLANRDLVMPSVAAAAIWTGYPFAMLSWLAALQGVNLELYDAAAVDGAGRWQSFVHVTFSSIRPVFVLLLLLEGIWVFNNFEMVYILTRGGPAHLTELLSTHAYTSAFGALRASYGATIATVQFVIVLALSLVYLRFFGSREDG